jgi:hypothetical protein
MPPYLEVVWSTRAALPVTLKPAVPPFELAVQAQQEVVLARLAADQALSRHLLTRMSKSSDGVKPAAQSRPGRVPHLAQAAAQVEQQLMQLAY